VINDNLGFISHRFRDMATNSLKLFTAKTIPIVRPLLKYGRLINYKSPENASEEN